MAPSVANRLTAGHSQDVSRGAMTHPYLLEVGPPPLRFEAPPPAPLPEPPAPVRPAAAPAKPSTDPKAVSAAKATAPATLAAQGSSASIAPPVPLEPSIIPDDARPRVRPEEFLPFFEAPSSQPPIPPSSATYKQD